MNKFSIFLLPLSLVFPFERPATLILILFFLIETLFHFKTMKSRFNFKVFLHPLVILFFSTLFFMKLRSPIGAWDRDLSLFLFPFYFSLRGLNKNDINLILKWFVWFLFLGLLFSLFHEFILEFYFKDYINLWKLKEHYNNSQLFYFIHSVSERIKFHHIYLSLYLFVGFLIGHYLIYSKLLKYRQEIVFTKICMTAFLLFTMLSVSRMSIICFILYGLGYLYYFHKKRKENLLLKSFIIISFLVLLIAFPNSIKSRFNKVLDDPRISLFDTSINLSKKFILFGYGHQNGEIEFINAQNENGNEVVYQNSHNQFLDYLLGGGIVMILFFIIVNYLLVKKYYKSKVFIGLIILFFFILQCSTEALLERYRGIVLFSFLISLFYYNKNQELVFKNQS
tara:strand:+ start:205 stop:1389 length:1185 start_codon:yes stop_codon:yes gene_type:complete